LFSQLVRDPRILYREYLEEPERFNEETGDLLHRLVAGQQKLEDVSSAERDLLNRATVELAQHSSKPSSPPPSPDTHSVPFESSDEEFGETEMPWETSGLEEVPELPQMEAPEDLPNAPTFWWRKP